MAQTQIKTPGIADNAVTAAKIANGAVGTTEIATGVSITGTLSGNSSTSTTFSTIRTNYKDITDGAVAGQLMWKNYGNNHTIFDASQSTSPNGGAVNSTNSQVAWTATYPTLMGWDGVNTYGVRVDSARVSDNTTGNAATVTNGVYTTGEQVITGVKRFYNSNGIIIGNDTTPVLPGGASQSKWLIRNTGGARGDLRFYTGNDNVPEWTDRIDFIDTGVIQANGFQPRSDYRLKENITPVNEISNLIKNISTYKFNLKSDPDNTIKYGFIAHELQEIFPNLVTGQKDGYKTLGILREYDGTLVSENIEKPESLIWEELITTNNDQQEKVTRTRTWEKTEETPVYQSISSDGLLAVAMQGLKESLNKIEILENSLNDKQKQLEECLDRIAKLENKFN